MMRFPLEAMIEKCSSNCRTWDYGILDVGDLVTVVASDGIDEEGDHMLWISSPKLNSPGPVLLPERHVRTVLDREGR